MRGHISRLTMVPTSQLTSYHLTILHRPIKPPWPHLIRPSSDNHAPRTIASQPTHGSLFLRRVDLTKPLYIPPRFNQTFGTCSFVSRYFFGQILIRYIINCCCYFVSIDFDSFISHRFNRLRSLFV